MKPLKPKIEGTDITKKLRREEQYCHPVEMTKREILKVSPETEELRH